MIHNVPVSGLAASDSGHRHILLDRLDKQTESTMKTFTFSKPEHLCLRSEIEALFGAGSHSLSAFPLRMVYRSVACEGSAPAVKVLLSVSKRRLRHAVDRNRAKRQLREAYRLHKLLLLSVLPPGQGYHIAFVWLSDRPVPSERVGRRMAGLLQSLAEKASPVVPACPDKPAES